MESKQSNAVFAAELEEASCGFATETLRQENRSGDEMQLQAPCQKAVPSDKAQLLDRLPSWVFSLMLCSASVIWGACFVSVKVVTEVIHPSTIIGIRFCLASLFMLIFFFPRIRANWNRRAALIGALYGLLYYLSYIFQVVGLTDTTPSKNAFIVGAAVIFVPFIYWILSRKRPTLLNVSMAFLCLIGLGLVTLSGDLTLRFGDAITMGSAIFFAAHIACVARYSEGLDIFTLTFIQFAVCGLLAIVFGLLTETQPSLDQILQPVMLAQLFFLAFVGAFLAPLFQNIGQTRVSASQAAIFLSLQSVFGTIFSILLYGEILTVKVAIGFVVIFTAVVLSELIPVKRGISNG